MPHLSTSCFYSNRNVINERMASQACIQNSSSNHCRSTF